jgi:cytochrome P450
MMQPHFHRKTLEVLSRRMAATIYERMSQWDSACGSVRPFDVLSAMAQVTANVTTTALFGASLERQEMDDVQASLRAIVDCIVWGMVDGLFPSWLPLPVRRRRAAAIRVLDDCLLRVVERCRQEKDIHSLVSMLVSMVDNETEERMTAAQLRDEAVTLFVGGTETTAVALSWAVDVLARHPEHARKLRAEVDTVLGDRLPTLADIPHLGFSLAFVQEVLRLYPPAFWLPRTAASGDRIDGWLIPSGAVVAPVTYTIHRHPEVWKDPERFDPSRFFPDGPPLSHPLAWMPFGAGPRLCIGKEFALMEMQMILACLMRRYQWHMVPGRTAKPHLSLTMRPRGGVWVSLQRRNPSEAAA